MISLSGVFISAFFLFDHFFFPNLESSATHGDLKFDDTECISYSTKSKVPDLSETSQYRDLLCNLANIRIRKHTETPESKHFIKICLITIKKNHFSLLSHIRIIHFNRR